MGKKMLEAEKRGLPVLLPHLSSRIHLLCEYYVSL